MPHRKAPPPLAGTRKTRRREAPTWKKRVGGAAIRTDFRCAHRPKCAAVGAIVSTATILSKPEPVPMLPVDSFRPDRSLDSSDDGHQA
jgi:hypothetical protein